MDGRMLSTWRCFTGHGSRLGVYFLSIPTGNHIFLLSFPKKCDFALFTINMPAAGFQPGFRHCSHDTPTFPCVCTSSFRYLCAGPLSDGRPSGLPSELLIGRCKSLFRSRMDANGDTARCIIPLQNWFQCPSRWSVFDDVYKTFLNSQIMCPYTHCSVNNCPYKTVINGSVCPIGPSTLFYRQHPNVIST